MTTKTPKDFSWLDKRKIINEFYKLIYFEQWRWFFKKQISKTWKRWLSNDYSYFKNEFTFLMWFQEKTLKSGNFTKSYRLYQKINSEPPFSWWIYANKIVRTNNKDAKRIYITYYKSHTSIIKSVYLQEVCSLLKKYFSRVNVNYEYVSWLLSTLQG